MKTIIPKKKQKLYYVKWQDAHANLGWLTTDELTQKINETVCTCEQVGWIVYEDEHEIHLVARRLMWGVSDDNIVGEWGLYSRIPKAWIFAKRQVKLN